MSIDYIGMVIVELTVSIMILIALFGKSKKQEKQTEQEWNRLMSEIKK